MKALNYPPISVSTVSKDIAFICGKRMQKIVIQPEKRFFMSGFQLVVPGDTILMEPGSLMV